MAINVSDTSRSSTDLNSGLLAAFGIQMSVVENLANSFDSLFAFLYSGRARHPQETVGDALNKVFNKLQKQLDAYGEPSKEARAQVQAGKITLEGKSVTLTQDERRFILQVSKFLQLDELETSRLLLSYLRNNPPSSRIDYDQQFMQYFVSFYFLERKYLLSTVWLLLCISDEEDSPYYSVARDIVDRLRERTDFGDRIVAQFRRKILEKIPTNFEGNLFSPLWIKHSLQEQRALLDILFILYYVHEHPSATTVKSLIELFEEVNFGQKQLHITSFDSECHSTSAQIITLCIVLTVEVINVEGVHSLNFSEAPSAERLVYSPDHIMQVNTIMMRLGTTQEHSLPMLAWSIFLWNLAEELKDNGYPTTYSEVEQMLKGRRWKETPSAESSGIEPFRAMAARAFKLDVFNYTLALLQSPFLVSGELMVMGYRGVLEGLFRVLFTTVRVSYLPNYDALVECVSDLIEMVPAIADRIWELAFSSASAPNLFPIIELARARFPVQFHPFMRLLGSLVKSKVSADATLKYLMQIPTYTYFLSPSDDIERDGSLVRVRSPLTLKPLGTKNLIIPAGTIGQIVSMPDEPLIVHWDFAYSGIQLFLNMIDAFLETSPLPSDSTDDSKVSIEMVTDIVEVLSGSLSHGSELNIVTDEMHSEFILRIFPLLTRCATTSPLPQKLVAGCVRCLTYSVPRSPNLIWSYLQQTSVIGGLKRIDSRQGSIQKLITSIERDYGNYPVTIAFLDLVAALLDDARANNPDQMDDITRIKINVLASCLLYIQNELFPAYNGWRYVRLSDRFSIGHKMLQIFTNILRDTTWLPKSLDEPTEYDSLSSLQVHVIRNFLYDGSLYHVGPLLDAVVKSPKIRDQLYLSGRAHEADVVETVITDALRFLQMLLTMRKVLGAGRISQLEQILLERTIGKENVEIVFVLASFILDEAWGREGLAVLAVSVLTLLCSLASDWKPHPPSFVGYFGTTEQARDLVAKFLHLLRRSDLVERDYVTLWNFVATAVQNQPGLAVLFLTGDLMGINESNQPSSAEQDRGQANSVVQVALEVLLDWQKILSSRPAVLASTLKFFDVLWQNAAYHQDLLARLRGNTRFWDALSAFLFHEKSITTSTPSRFFAEDVVEWVSDADEAVSNLCNDYISRAHALRIIGMEVHNTRSLDEASTPRSRFEALPSRIRDILTKLSAPNKLLEWRKHFTRTDYDESLHRSLKEELNRIWPATLLPKLKMLTWSDIYDAQRQYGDSYAYDLELARRKLRVPVAFLTGSGETKSGEHNHNRNLLLLMCAANHNWSLVDAQLVLLRSYKMFIEIITFNFESALWMSTGSEQLLFRFIKSIAMELANETRRGEVMATIRWELGNLLVALLDCWSKYCAEAVATQESRKELAARFAEIVMILQGALENKGFLLEDSVLRIWGDVPYHRPLLQCLLLCLRGLKQSDLEVEADRNIRSSYRALLPALCAILRILFSKPVRELSANDEATACHLLDVAVVISLLEETVQPARNPHVSSWLPVLYQYDIVPTTLALFAELTNEATPKALKYAESLLHLVLTLADIPTAAERLASDGVMEMFANNALTPLLQEGAVSPSLQTNGTLPRGMTTAGLNEHELRHRLWILMLAIVSTLVRRLGTSEQFLGVVVSFIKMYGAQFGRCFDAPGDVLTLRQLEEVEYASSLFHYVSFQRERVQAMGASHILQAYIDRCLVLLMHYTYFFGHPRELAGVLVPTKPEERELAGEEVEYVGEMNAKDTPAGDQVVPPPSLSNGVGASAKNGGNNKVPLLAQLASQRLLKITRTMLSTLTLLTGAETVLTKMDVEWPLDSAIIYPFSKTVPSEGTSIGTLLDCLTHAVQVLESPSKRVGDKVRGYALQLIREVVVLIITQLTIRLASPATDLVAKQEICSEVAGDLKRGIDRVQGCLSALADEKGGGLSEEAGETRETVALLVKFAEMRQLLG
ncbi:uncharacterized protein VTP21DRAFT_10972 [Calcarisporiella thermophila]|uniref:uncharacterized protein n=1 Tax=Calcarisporiella thermophila TaxID=911321 RepID=UPI0037420497